SVLRVANGRGIPVVTDQTGFRAPTGAVQIDLSRFEGITRLSAHSLFVEVEAGVQNHKLEEMLHRHGPTPRPPHPPPPGPPARGGPLGRRGAGAQPPDPARHRAR